VSAAFEARAASKRFGARRVLEQLDLSVPEGSVTVLLGRNGAGKTTLLRAAVGMTPLDAGSIRVAGIDAAKSPVDLRQRVGFVPDRADAYPWMTAAALFRFLRPMYRRWSEKEAERLGAAFEVPLDVPFQAMSRGQGIKAILAAALAPNPAVLLLDEPFGGLDPVARDEVLRAIVGEVRSGSRTVICSTHDLAIASRIADHVAILADGRIERLVPIDDLEATDKPVPAALRSALEPAHVEVPR
jgi:ABC-2 type transport system ATP-binding protein